MNQKASDAATVFVIAIVCSFIVVVSLIELFDNDKHQPSGRKPATQQAIDSALYGDGSAVGWAKDFPAAMGLSDGVER